jgi:hypothetical protein
MKDKPRAVEVMLKEDIPGPSVPLTGAMDLVEGNFTPVDFKSAAAKPDEANAAFNHEIQLVSYQLQLEGIGEGIGGNRHYPQPGMHCNWCHFRNERMASLPGIQCENGPVRSSSEQRVSVANFSPTCRAV